MQPTTKDRQTPETEIKSIETTQNREAGQPRDRLLGRVTMPDPLPREETLAPNNRTVLQGDAIYTVVRHRVPQAPGIPGAFGGKRYEASGDHVYVAEVNTVFPTYIKLGLDQNPWIRVRQGMTFRRTFNRLKLQSVDDGMSAGQLGFAETGEVLLYVSTGPLIEDTASDFPGVDESVAFFNSPTDFAAATNVPGPLAPGILTAAGLIPVTSGKTPGFLVISNTDLSNTLYLTKSNSIAQGFPLLPGVSITMPLKSKILSRADTANAINGIYVATAAGTCNYAILLSPWEQDSFDVTSRQSGGMTG